MKYFQYQFLILVLLHISTISTKKILLDYNDELDFITKDGKLYFPISQEESIFKIKHLRSLTKYKENRKLEEEEPEKVICEEEMVTGSTY